VLLLHVHVHDRVRHDCHVLELVELVL